MKNDGERVLFADSWENEGDAKNLILHLERYVWAMKFVHNKTVLDVACGTMYGSWLLSLVASEVIGVDINEEAIEYGRKKLKAVAGILRHKAQDISKSVLPEADVCVSFETIEHLDEDGGKFFLTNLKTKELIFSFPLQVDTGLWHKRIFTTPEMGLDFIRDCGWNIAESKIQDTRFVLGRALK